MEQTHRQQRRVVAWLTSAVVAIAMFAPTAVQAAEIMIQKPGH
jgi:hypothetical protein